VSGPTIRSLFHYASFALALKSFLRQPGDGRMRPRIPAASLGWGLLPAVILPLRSANRLEWLARSAGRKQLGLTSRFGDDALAYFTERADPEVIRRRLAATLKLAKTNKVFEETAHIGLAIDGTGAGGTRKEACPFCHPIRDAQANVTCQIHRRAMVSVVGAGITLPFDVEPYRPGDSEYAAGKRSWRSGGPGGSPPASPATWPATGTSPPLPFCTPPILWAFPFWRG
jgi:hypothetical protein